LRKSVKDKTEIKITKVVKAGSFAKFTILRKTTYDPVDVDIVFYISGRDASKEMNRPGIVGGSNFQIGWSHDKQNDEQVFSRGAPTRREIGVGSRG